MSTEYKIDYTVERNDQEIELVVKGTVSPFVRGRFSGPPERCYPDEGGEVEITAVLWPSGASWDGELTEQERDRIEELLRDADVDKWHDDHEPPDDDDEYDDPREYGDE